MAIHFENYKTFSKGQGFVGVACREVSPLASTKRWFACDCPDCKATLVGRRIISRDDVIAEVLSVSDSIVTVQMPDGEIVWPGFDEIDKNWAPLPSTAELFGEVGEDE